MTFRKPNRPHHYTWPTLPGIGRVGPWSTGATSKRLADAVEAWLRQTALADPEAVRGIVAGKYSLREAYVAHQEGRLGSLKATLTDPLLSECVRAYESTQSDRRKLEGLQQLLSIAPAGARLSWLTQAKNITAALNQARASGRKTNSVHRSLYAAIKGVLGHELGKARKREITADVDFAYEDDTRHVDVTPAQLAAVLGRCDAQVYDIAIAAMLTGVDVGPLLRLTPSSFDFERGTMRVHDTKAFARQRMLELDDTAAAHFRRLVAGVRTPEEPLFRLSDKQLSGRWRVARRQAGAEFLRFKDLRHVFANAWVDEGGSLADLGGVLGHTRGSTTLRYTARQAREVRERMGRVAERLGLKHQHLRAQGGGG